MLFTLLARSLGLRPDRARRARRPRPVPPRRSFVPQLMVLEDRTVPSTFTVKNLHDGGPDSLRAAVVAANANPDADVIKFAGNVHGTITLASELSITQDVTIDGPGAGKIALSGGGATRVFNISGATTDVTIYGLTIADGRAVDATFDGPFGPVVMGGGILNNQSHLTLSNVTLADNQAVGGAVPNVAGGAIANVFGATLTVTQSTFSGNTVGGGSSMAGGAIESDAGASAVIDHSTFTGNQAVGGNSFGGAVSSNASALKLSQCIFDGNLAQGGVGGGVGFGGAVDVEPVGFFAGAVPTVTIDACVFCDNRALGGAGADGGAGGQGLGGAADIVTDGSEATVSRSLFCSNLARGGDGDAGGPGGQGDGGALAVYVYAGETGTVVTASDDLFDGNQARGGDGGPGLFDGLAFGGAIANSSAALNVRGSAFTDNEARGGDGVNGPGKAGLGGAIAGVPLLAAPDTLPTTDVIDSLFAGNRALGGDGAVNGAGGDGAGGAVFNLLGTLTVRYSLLAGNEAVGGAGGAEADGGLGSGGAVQNGFFGFGGTAAISDALIVCNEAVGGAGGAGGGHGGDGQGGGLYNGPGSTMTVNQSDIGANRASGGAAGSGGGVAGLGSGGGIYDLGLISLDAQTHVHGDKADAFADCFGCP